VTDAPSNGPGLAVADAVADDRFADLQNVIMRCQREAGGRKVRRVTADFYFAMLNPLISFQEIVSAAVEQGAVKVGGAGSSAWIALGTDNVHDDDDSSHHFSKSDSVDSLTSVAATALPQSPPGSSLSDPPQWFITLRYGMQFRVYSEIHGFSDPSKRILRQVEPSGVFERMAVGPFETSGLADRYFQRNFSFMNLRPKISTKPELSVLVAEQQN
jgi:hypothetical protein